MQRLLVEAAKAAERERELGYSKGQGEEGLSIHDADKAWRASTAERLGREAERERERVAAVAAVAAGGALDLTCANVTKTGAATGSVGGGELASELKVELVSYGFLIDSDQLTQAAKERLNADEIGRRAIAHAKTVEKLANFGQMDSPSIIPGDGW